MNIKISYTPDCRRLSLKDILHAVEETNKRTLRYSESMTEEADVYVIQIDDNFKDLKKHTKIISKDIPGTIFIVVGDYWEIYYKGEGLGLIQAFPIIKEV